MKVRLKQQLALTHTKNFKKIKEDLRLNLSLSTFEEQCYNFNGRKKNFFKSL